MHAEALQYTAEAPPPTSNIPPLFCTVGLGQIAKFKDHQYFQIYGTLLGPTPNACIQLFEQTMKFPGAIIMQWSCLTIRPIFKLKIVVLM